MLDLLRLLKLDRVEVRLPLASTFARLLPLFLGQIDTGRS